MASALDSYLERAAPLLNLVLATMLSDGESVISSPDGAKMKVLGQRPDDEKALKKGGGDIVAAFQQNEKSKNEMVGSVKVLFGFDNQTSLKFGDMHTDSDGYAMSGASFALGFATAGGIFTGVNKEKTKGKLVASIAYGAVGYEFTVVYDLKPPPPTPGVIDLAPLWELAPVRVASQIAWTLFTGAPRGGWFPVDKRLGPVPKPPDWMNGVDRITFR